MVGATCIFRWRMALLAAGAPLAGTGHRFSAGFEAIWNGPKAGDRRAPQNGCSCLMEAVLQHAAKASGGDLMGLSSLTAVHFMLRAAGYKPRIIVSTRLFHAQHCDD